MPSVIECERCPRLRKYCQEIAQKKKKAFHDQTYWGKPVPGFGDPDPQLFIIGLAPAAHGANRTGRMFTGDNSGLWLYRALHRAAFANQAEATHSKDGLRLRNAYIAAVARCAPPDNKPTPEEIENCASFLSEEFHRFKHVRVYMALGQLAWTQLWKHLKKEGRVAGSIPKFTHGVEIKTVSGQYLLGSYHPSQQNTFTGKLTEPMLDSVFTKANQLISKAQKNARDVS